MRYENRRIFQKKRIEKGLSYDQLARLISDDFQESLFWDFESGDDNDIDGMAISDFKRYCSALDIVPSEFADIPISDMVDLSLPLLVKTRREEKGLSIENLSDLIGYNSEVVEALENNRKDTVVCLDALKGIAKELDIPFTVLLAKL